MSSMFQQISDLCRKPTEDTARSPRRVTVAGRTFQEMKLLSEGGFGFIWLAHDIQSREEVALKRSMCVNEERLKAARRELQVLKTLPKHPNLVEFYAGEELMEAEGRTVVVVMELCQGSLFEELEKRVNGNFSEEELVNVAKSVAGALKALHSAGLYHRDVKVENVLVNKAKQLKLCDFGSCTEARVDFARMATADFVLAKEAIDGFTTPMYRSPEMVDPYLRYEVGPKSDVWMLGCVIYTLAYFMHPFVNSSAVGIAAAVLAFPPERPVSSKMQDFIRHMLTPNPQHRPSAQEVLEIATNWASLPMIALNVCGSTQSEAATLKARQVVQEQELQRLSAPMTSFDGDIPLEELAKLQHQLSLNKDGDQAKSFITKKSDQHVDMGARKSGLAGINPTHARGNAHSSNTFLTPSSGSNPTTSLAPNYGTNPNSSLAATSSNAITHGNAPLGRLNPASVGMTDFWLGSSTRAANSGSNSFAEFSELASSLNMSQPKISSESKPSMPVSPHQHGQPPTPPSNLDFNELFAFDSNPAKSAPADKLGLVPAKGECNLLDL